MQRNITFDIARGLCIILIVAYWHVLDYISIKPIFFVQEISYQFVTSALALFIFLSGYFMGKKKICNIDNVKQFYLKRLVRFYPLFFLSALLMFGIGMFSFGTFIKSILGLTPYWPPQPPTLWFICMLLGFYLITPIILIQKRRLNQFVVSAAVFILIFLFHHFIREIDDRVFMYYPFYILGLIVPLDNWLKLMEKPKFFFVFGALVFVSTYFKFHSVHIITRVCNISYVYNSLGSCFIITLSSLMSKAGILKSLLLKISHASMSIYMFHRQIYFIFIQILPVKLSIQILYFAIIVIPVTFFIAYYIQKGYDILIDQLKVKDLILEKTNHENK